MSAVCTQLGIFSYTEDASGPSATRMIISVCNLFMGYLDDFIAQDWKQWKPTSIWWMREWLGYNNGALIFIYGQLCFSFTVNLYYEKIMKVRWFSHFLFGFCMEETVYSWHLIFPVPSVCWFPCCEQIQSNVWVYGEEIIIRIFSKKVNSLWHLNALGRWRLDNTLLSLAVLALCLQKTCSS